MIFTYIKQPLRKYTFEAPKIMAWVETELQNRFPTFRASESITDGNTSDWKKVPAGKDVTITVYPGAGATVSVDVTDGTYAQIDAATAPANEWEPGGVTSATTRTYYGSITGVRFETAGGDATCTILIGK